jgi:GNAT superfamily N-acetyltransferase
MSDAPSGPVRRLQERAARALPAESTKIVNGWWLRHAPGCSWWAGTVLPHGAVRPDALTRRVIEAEEFYARNGAAARFQITPGVCPAGLDTLLAVRGYRRQSVMSLQVASTARVAERAPAAALRGYLSDCPTRAWLDVWDAVHGHGGDSSAEVDMLRRVTRPSAYAGVMVGADVVAVGRAVADTGWVGVFGMGTLPAARGSGAARQVLAALAGWAGAHRADRMYLQVERDNLPALRLYARAGFREICGYHYRAAG